VIKGQGGHGALAIARSLGRLGIPTYLVTEKGPSAVSSSRYWVKTFTWDFSAPRDRSLQFLLDVGRQIGSRPILLAITDWAAIFIEDNASALKERFIFPNPAPPLIRRLANKWEMFLAAKEHGIPTPEAAYPQSRDDVLKFLQAARLPIVMKGADLSSPQAKWKEIVQTAGDLLERYDRAAASGPPNLILQEYIPGGDDTVWMCNAYFDAASECRAVFAGRKLRQYPAHVGIASLAVCAPNETVENATRHFMQAVGYKGCVGIGYRYDSRDGLYKVLDVNARVSAIFRLFVSPAGMDVVRVCYLDLTGQPIPALAPSPGRKWLLEEDIFSAPTYAREGSLTFTQWLRSLRGVKEMHWFAADDLAPILVWSWSHIHPLLRGAVRRVKSFGQNVVAFWTRRTPALPAGPPDATSSTEITAQR
jgi:predicted ATP-grasp superfamily ATP-dependent carboligase